MAKEGILLIDDEQTFLEGLADALEAEGYRVFKARTGTEAIRILGRESVRLATVDVMMPYAETPAGVPSHRAGVQIIKDIKKRWPDLDIFCISVIYDAETIRAIRHAGARFLRKGETPLRTLLAMITSRARGIAYRDPGY